MSKICYMVIATLPSAAVAEEYIAWLRDGHMDQVVGGGASSAMLVRLDLAGGQPRVMTQYQFASRHVFDEYVQLHAPALRAEGLKKFGPERGVRMERMLGEVA